MTMPFIESALFIAMESRNRIPTNLRRSIARSGALGAPACTSSAELIDWADQYLVTAERTGDHPFSLETRYRNFERRLSIALGRSRES